MNSDKNVKPSLHSIQFWFISSPLAKQDLQVSKQFISVVGGSFFNSVIGILGSVVGGFNSVVGGFISVVGILGSVQ